MAVGRFVVVLVLAAALHLPAPCEGEMASKAANTTARLARLRNLMRGPPQLNAYLVPTADAHQSEYISAYDARREFISGFTGSSGDVIVTPTEALLWTDGRYYLQAENQLDSNWQLMKESLPTTPSREDWLLKNLPPRSNVGANPTLVSNSEWEPLHTALTEAGHTLVPIEKDLIDLTWEQDETARPPRPSNKIFALPLNFSGKTTADKLVSIREKMAEKNASALVVTALDSVAYLFNLRGSDIPYNPVFFAYAVVTRNPDNLHLITRSELFESDIEAHFAQQNITSELKIVPYDNAFAAVADIIASLNISDSKVWISRGSSRAVHLAANANTTNKVKILSELEPVALMKAVKNSVETQGLIDCHIRDGAALARYFSWLEEELVTNGNRNITEISGADMLESFRRELTNFVGLSFSTISGSGPNGAIIHYKPEPSTDRALSTDEMYLCDSGAQYWDGTTDVTRTLHFGTPTQAQKEAFTLVLKGQIALGQSVFPTKVKGNVLDTIARRYLWQQGMNYAHGTGHGIGHFLNVHEGPMGISWRQYLDDPGLMENMFLSNEPGYYQNGEYGIRIEDIIRIVTLIPPGNMTKDKPAPRGLKDNFAGQGALGFETVTMCPIQKKLIEVNMLTEDEINHINNYHRTVYEKVSPILDSMNWTSAKAWLAENTSPL